MNALALVDAEPLPRGFLAASRESASPALEVRPWIRSYSAGDEFEIVALLNRVFPGGWGDVDRWRARHSERPGFNPADIYLAVWEDRIVACLHTAVFPTSLGPGLTVPMAVDGDLAIEPEFRSRGVAERLYAESTERLAARNVVLRTGYSESSTRVHYYCRVLGYVTGFDATTAWNKQLDASVVRDRLLRLFRSSPDAVDPGHGPIVEIAITGLDPIRLRLGSGAVALSRSDRADLILSADQRLLSLFARNGGGLKGVVELLKRRAIHVRGLLSGGFRVALWAVLYGCSMAAATPIPANPVAARVNFPNGPAG
jgi:GNAT superfamily N-acetyltransferase